MSKAEKTGFWHEKFPRVCLFVSGLNGGNREMANKTKVESSSEK